MNKKVNNYMKKVLLIGALLLTLGACSTPSKEPEHEHEYEVVVEEGWKTCIAGKDFNSEGLNVYEKCKTCGDVKEVDYSLENATSLEMGQTNITIKVGDTEINYPITVKEKYHIACVGDSLTAGHMWANQSYPTYLSSDVSEDYEVLNCGENGISITGYGGNSIKYIERTVYQNSINFAPDIFAIMLGTNDATGWANAEATFVEDYHYLIDSYIELFPNARFIMMIAPPTTTPNQFNIPNDVIRDSVNPIQRELAEEYEMEVIDLREEFEATENYEQLYLRPNGDGVHFTVEAAQYVAGRVWETAKDLRF